MSASGEIIRRLLARGLTGQQIGQAVGRDRSLISQVGRDVKPGQNLETALAELERRAAAGRPLTAPEPARRTTKTGRLARVRKPSTVRGAAWRTTTIKRQAAASGGRSLDGAIAEAADAGQRVRVTITFDKSVQVSGSYGKRGRAGAGGAVDVELDPDEYLASMEPGKAMAVEYLLGLAAEDGYVPDDTTPGQVESVELRVF